MRVFLILSLFLFLISCEKQDDYNKISYQYRYHSNFSFAVGNSYLNLLEMGKYLPWNWQNEPSLLNIPDTLLLEDRMPFEPQGWLKEGSEKISNITIKIRGYNEFPAKVHFILQLEDSIKKTEYLVDLFIPESVFQSDSIPEMKGNFETFVHLTKEKIMQFKSMKKLLIIAKIENKTKRNEYYALYKNLKVLVGIGVQVQFDFNIQDIQ